MSAAASQASASGEAVRPKRTGLAVFFAGVACEVLGFVLLARGSMDLSPALLVGSFGVMALGIWMGW